MKKLSRFIGREAEMATLKGLLNKRSSSLIVVRGRRRIGKSRLLKEFGKGMKSFFFSGLPPKPKKKITSKAQRKEFVGQLEQQGIFGVSHEDWSQIFWQLAKHTQEGRVFIVLDEISWMGSKDPDFLGKLKNAWDLHFSNNPELILVLCGSISSWIEDNILSSTGYFGRVILDIVLEELPLQSCNAFWNAQGSRISAYEKFKVLSVTGGVPLYLELVKPELNAEANIREMCFKREGLLSREFEQIFSDLFSKRSGKYKEIVQCLATGSKELPEICDALNKKKGGMYNKYLSDLVKAGYVKRDFSWQLKTGKSSKLSKYRLSDNYLRFYLKYCAPHRQQIESGRFADASLTALPAWDTVMGFQFENLVVHNRATVWKLLGIPPADIVMDGPYFQSHTATRAGCQIDYLIQTRFDTLYLCEIKFHKKPIGSSIIEEIEQKRKSLVLPKHYSLRPVLIHVNGVDDSVIDSRYFDQILDFGQLLLT